MLKQKIRPQYQSKINYSKISLLIIISTFILVLPSTYNHIKQQIPSLKNITWHTWYGHLPNQSLIRIKKAVYPLLQQYYTDINNHKIKAIIEQNSWVKSVIIKRLFWSKLNINIRTKKIALHLNQDSYIDKDGIVFSPKHLLKTLLPLAIGNKKDSHIIYVYYENYQDILGENLIIKIVKYQQTLELVIDNNTTLKLGYDKHQERLENFIKHYLKIKQKYHNINNLIIDLRYKNGFAISKKAMRHKY